MKITKEYIARSLEGCQYNYEIDSKMEKILKENKFLVIVGRSDDSALSYGLFVDNSYGEIYLDKNSFYTKKYGDGCTSEEELSKSKYSIIIDYNHFMTFVSDTVEFAEFSVYEEEILYGHGIVIDMKDYFDYG